jgi:hypothetical protein
LKNMAEIFSDYWSKSGTYLFFYVKGLVREKGRRMPVDMKCLRKPPKRSQEQILW